MGGDSVRLVILSDTHGRLPREVLRACEGADHIVHAGDVGSEDILHELGAVAPVTAVCGNVDRSEMIPLRAWVDVGKWRVLVQHIVWERGGPSAEIRDLISRESIDLLIFGHSHEPLCRQMDDLVFLNPGSCGPKRFSLPMTYAEALLEPDEGGFRIFDLEDSPRDSLIFEERFNKSR
ncbi:metallophosphoesterase family protein [Nitrospinota bacterium]